MKQKAIVWFRNDLRLHDNEALTEALSRANEIIPVFVFDERVFFGKTSKGFRKTERFRAKFIIESIQDLKANIQNRGGNLIVKVGKPEEIIYELALRYKTSWVYCNRERTDDEVRVQNHLEKKLWTIGQELRFVRGKMLLHTADLPFPVSQVPDTFTTFRKEIEGNVDIRIPIETPQFINCHILKDDLGEIPSLEDLDYDTVEYSHIENDRFRGGESHGLNQLNYFLYNSHLIKQYKELRNNLLGWDYSSKLSAWLSLGCLSPKYVYSELKKYESLHGANESTYWLFFELLWRDYFRLVGKKYGNKIFSVTGLRNKAIDTKNNSYLFDLWRVGQTGMPIIDACMRQLNQTGYISNRGRQLIASFLVKDLELDWIYGAEYLESLLIDYDPCSNYGNWLYIAGIGNDPREDRYFNILNQAKRYDPHGEFVKYWVKEIKDIPHSYVHQPFSLDIEAQSKHNIVLGQTYPNLIINPKKWAH